MLEGDVVWAGRGPLGGTDGKVALYLRTQLASLWYPVPEDVPDGVTHRGLLSSLEKRGASFFHDLYQELGGGSPDLILDALWDLVWAGLVTNDTLAPLRAYTGTRGGSRSRPTGNRPTGNRLTGASRFPAHAAGRWSRLIPDEVDPTIRASAWSELLLDRHGVITRNHVAGEGIPGGFTGIYPVLTRLEETGRVRRGYFVEGLGGAQFALPGAVDRLRQPGTTGVVGIAATDPANPYGAFLPWPEVAGGRLARAAGSYVLMAEGRLAAYLERGGRRLLLLDFDRDLGGEMARELAAIARRYRRLTLETVGESPAAESGLAPALSEWGFVPAVRGLAYRG